MSNGLGIARDALNEFKEIQRYMLLAKEEKYLFLKALLNTAGVNLSEINRIKE